MRTNFAAEMHKEFRIFIVTAVKKKKICFLPEAILVMETIAPSKTNTILRLKSCET